MSLAVPKRLQQSAAYHRAPHMERAVARQVGGETTLASGSQYEKADVRVTGVARLECKATGKGSFSVTRAMLDKLSAAAESAGELPVLLIEFLPTKTHAGGRVVVCPEYVLSLLQTVQTSIP